MKHKTLRTLLCVILTVCFCLSAIVPASAAGLFGGESGIASQWDQWIRSMKDLKDRIIEKNPGTDETPAEPMAGTGEEFIRIFHLDCGRKYFSVAEIKDIIDQLAANHYTHIELAFGNDGFRFLLDDMAVGGYTFTSEQVKSAIQAGNSAYYNFKTNELTEAEMDDIIAYAKKGGKNNGHSISVIPMVDVPGHANALMTAMTKLGISVSTFYKESNNGLAFDVSNKETTSFVTALLEKYIGYFAKNGCEYFNLGADECGYNVKTFSYSSLINDLLSPLGKKIADSGMTPLMFNDGFRSSNNLQTLVSNLKSDDNKPIFAICYWTANDDNGYATAAQLANDFQLINTNTHWYYIAGNEGTGWGNYNYAIAKMKQDGFKANNCDSDTQGKIMPMGCMLAFWCDQPGQSVNYSNLYTYIKTLSEQNPNYFKAASETPLPSIVIGGNNTELTVGENVIMSTSDGSLATWTSSNTGVLEVAATTRAVENTSSVIVTAVGVGTAAVSATLDNGTVFTSDTITVSATRGDEEFDREITVSVGGTANDTILNVNETLSETEYTDGTGTVIARVSAVGKAGSTSDTYTKVSVTLSELAGDNTEYTKTDYYYRTRGGSYYPVYAYKHTYTWPGGSTVYYYYGYEKDGTITLINSSSNDSSISLYTKDDPTPSTTVTFNGVAVGTTYATVAGVRYKINVIAEVIPDGEVLPIQLWITNNTIQVDGTSATKTGSGWGGNAAAGYKANYVNVTAQSAYGENGISLYNAIGLNEPLVRYEYGGTRYINYSDLPEQDGRSSQNLVLWTGRIHNKADGNVQTMWGADGNSDYSNSGSAFNYVRYYGGKWAVSADGKTGWTTVTGDGSTGTYSGCTQQLAAYYMIRTDITEEVKTDVADWGEPKDSTKYNEQVASDFVLLDFAVKYEDGSQNPKENAFPVANKTMAFHCNNSSTDSAIGGSGNTRYRKLNNFRAANTGDYEVYMVTVTMTNALASEQLTKNDALSSYMYDKKTEQIVWAIDEATLDNSVLTAYTPISGTDSVYAGCTIGGDPYVRGVEVYLNHGVLITYYVRAKTGALTVHYHDRTRNDQEFYNYNIVVNAGTFFDPNFRQKAPNSLELENHIVKNKYNVDQAVSADLITMRGIPAQYRYSKYTCVKVELVTPDGAGGPTEVHLYYTFSADVSFVVDFGLPLTIPYTELNENLKNEEVKITSITASSPVFGSVKVNGTSGITYTPNKTLDQIDSFKVACTGTIPVKSEDGTTTYQEGTVEYTVHIIPATNVLYEENFMTPSGSNSWGTSTAPTTKQTMELGGAKTYVYGYEQELVKGNTTNYSGDSAYVANLTLPADKKSVYTKDNLTFSFTGAGFDLISECGKDTGMVVVRLENAETKEAKVYIIDTYFHGDNTILNNTHKIYQTPVIRELALVYGTYNVTIRGALYKNSGTVVNQPAAADVSTYSMQASAFAVETETFDIRAFLDDCGFEDVSVDDVELVYMDENSVLNGGTGIQSEAAAPVERSAAFSTYAMNAETEAASSTKARVTIDGFRVYNPLKNGSDVYTTDNESGVKYNDLSKYIQSNSTTGALPTETKNFMYVEYNSELKQAESANYNSKPFGTNGPKYEIYLAPNCGIAVGLPDDFTEKDILQLSAKIVSGTPTLKIGMKNGSFKEIKVGNQNAGLSLTGTEMYYDISDCIQATNDGKKFITIINGTSAGEQEGSQSVLAVNVLKMSENKATNEMSEETQNYILASLTESMATPIDDTFEPEVFEVYAPTTARRNRTFSISANVSVTDLEKVTIAADDGTETELNALNRVSVKWGISSEYYYLKTFRMRDSGEHTFKITAYGKDGSSVSKTVTVLVK